MLIPNTSTYIYSLFFALHSMLLSRFSSSSSSSSSSLFFSCVYVNGDHAHTNEQERRNQILFEHAINITARTRICPRAHIRMITAVRASTHSHAYIERSKRERERETLKYREASSFHSLIIILKRERLGLFII
jgi:hypothetical protein